MDKLETVKAEGNDAIVDDVAAKAYVEVEAWRWLSQHCRDDAIELLMSRA